jgi:hypothetical protein
MDYMSSMEPSRKKAVNTDVFSNNAPTLNVRKKKARRNTTRKKKKKKSTKKISRRSPFNTTTERKKSSNRKKMSEEEMNEMIRNFETGATLNKLRDELERANSAKFESEKFIGMAQKSWFK